MRNHALLRHPHRNPNPANPIGADLEVGSAGALQGIWCSGLGSALSLEQPPPHHRVPSSSTWNGHIQGESAQTAPASIWQPGCCSCGYRYPPISLAFHREPPSHPIGELCHSQPNPNISPASAASDRATVCSHRHLTKRYELTIRDYINCGTNIVVLSVECTSCNLQYVGCTTRP